MNVLTGDVANKFVAWLAVAKGFLPKSMTIDEASRLFLRRHDELEREAKKQ